MCLQGAGAPDSSNEEAPTYKTQRHPPLSGTFFHTLTTTYISSISPSKSSTTLLHLIRSRSDSLKAPSREKKEPSTADHNPSATQPSRRIPSTRLRSPRVHVLQLQQPATDKHHIFLIQQTTILLEKTTKLLTVGLFPSLSALRWQCNAEHYRHTISCSSTTAGKIAGQSR